MLRALRDEILRLPGYFQYLSSPAEHLPGYEKWNQLFGDFPEIDIAPHEEVFMASVGIPQGIRISLKNIDFSRQPFLSKPLLRCRQTGFQQALARFIVDHEFKDVVALRSRVFGVTAGVLIEPRPVDQEGVRRPAIRNQSFKDVPQNFFHGEIDTAVGGKNEAVFVLEAEYPLFHGTSRHHEWPSDRLYAVCLVFDKGSPYEGQRSGREDESNVGNR